MSASLQTAFFSRWSEAAGGCLPHPHLLSGIDAKDFTFLEYLAYIFIGWGRYGKMLKPFW